MAAMPFQYSTTGFYKTPVSKGLLGCLFLTSCALNVPLLAHLKKHFLWNYRDVFVKYEMWRLITSKGTFLETKDLICGSLLLYYFRIFERRYGSHKYASSLLATTVVTTFVEVLVAVGLHWAEFEELRIFQSGPHCFIFPMFINYFFDIPRVAQTSVLGVPVTGKTLTYLLGLQMVSSSKNSAISGICGLIAGLVYRYDILKIQSVVTVPAVVACVMNKLFGWMLQSSAPQESVVPLGATVEIQRQQQLEALEQQMLLNHAREMRNMVAANQHFVNDFNNQANHLYSNHNEYGFSNLRHRTVGEGDRNEPSVAGPSVKEEHVQRLVEMGFDRQSVLEALRTSNDDVTVATNMLLQDS